MDLTLRLRAPDDRPILPGRTEFSLLRMRAAAALFPSGGGQIRSSSDGDGVEAIHGQSAAWCAATGVVRGETVGFVLLDHPANLWHPPLWVCRSDGTLAPSPLWGRTLSISRQEPLLLRYRVHTHLGYVEPAWAAERLAEFARSPLQL